MRTAGRRALSEGSKERGLVAPAVREWKAAGGPDHDRAHETRQRPVELTTVGRSVRSEGGYKTDRLCGDADLRIRS